MKSKWVALTGALLVTLGTLSVAAQPTDAQKAHAKKLYLDGEEKHKAGQSKEALRLFQRADEIMGVPLTRYRLAQALADLGRLVEARDKARSVKAIEPAANESDTSKEARRRAAELAKELNSRVARAVFAVKPTNARLSLDGKVLKTKEHGGVDLDPGKHTVRSNRDGFEPFENTFEVQEGELRTVKVTLVSLPKPVSTPPVTKDSSSGFVFGPVSWAGVGIAAAGLITGSVAGGITLSRVPEIEDNCTAGDGDDCYEPFHDKRSAMLTSAHVATAGFVLAGVGAGIGLVGLFALDKPAEGDVAVTPLLGPGFVGMRGAF